MVATSTLEHFVLAALIASPTVYAAPVRLSPGSAHGLDRRPNVVEDRRETSLPNSEQLQVRGIEIFGMVVGKRTPEQRRKRMEKEIKALEMARDNEIYKAWARIHSREIQLRAQGVNWRADTWCRMRRYAQEKIERNHQEKVAALKARYESPSTASAQHPEPVTDLELPFLSPSSTLVGETPLDGPSA